MELPPEQLEQLGQSVDAFIRQYLAALAEGSVLPGETPERLRRLFAEPLPRQPQGLQAVLDDFINKVAANSARVGHPRFLAWIRTSPLAVAIYSEALAAALNQSVAVWEGAPAAAEVELRVIEWLKEMSGYAPQAGGILTSGGSIANFICLLAARSAALPEVRQTGLYGGPPLSVYVTRETHYCIPKAVQMMGIGQQAVRVIATDAELRMDPDALRRQIQIDRAAGVLPMAVAATLGTVNSGACDDLIRLAEVCREENVWLHVDGAYGGVAAMVPEKAHLAAGLAQADSFVVDPHKGLFLPFEAGCALVRDPAHLRAAFAMQADYLPSSQDEAPLQDPFNYEGARPFHFREYGPQLSRSFRALKVYLTLKAYGADALAQGQARMYRLTAELGRRLAAAPDFELLAPVVLGIVAFRYRPPRQNESDERLDRLNRDIAVKLAGDGKVFLSTTRIQGKLALRVCFVSHRTQESDLNILIDEVRAAGEQLSPHSQPQAS